MVERFCQDFEAGLNKIAAGLFILETSVERGFFSVKPPGYWREADFPIHL
jgi:hypothetical protein